MPFQEILIEAHESFQKQTYRNRCHILTAQGVSRLTIPLTSKHGHVLIKDVRIDYQQKWLLNHWRTIESAYRNAPFYEYYADDLRKVLFKKSEFLFDLNVELLTICLKWLALDIPIRESLSYEKTVGEGVADFRNVVNAKKPTLCEPFIKTVPYTQVFGNAFVKQLSLIDLVFCEGPMARKIIEAGANPEMNILK